MLHADGSRSMKATVTSDVHLGSKALDVKPFINFLKAFPDGEWLILNGDVVNRNCDRLPEEHTLALTEIANLSRRARVTWIRGNHDETYEPDDPAKIEFVDFCLIEAGVAILHGHDFRHKHLRNRPLVYILRAIHRIRKYIGSEPAYVSCRITDKNILVRILRRHIIANAFSLAEERGLNAIVCGHIHLAESIDRDGRRYLNTGSWLNNKQTIENRCLTLEPSHDAGNIECKRIDSV